MSDADELAGWPSIVQLTVSVCVCGEGVLTLKVCDCAVVRAMLDEDGATESTGETRL